ncbi:MAG TPA: NADH-quinone oxidoreductase subunit B family protein [Spirochaetota bacterium]|jgi:Ni,Fe-hydrogenase III small subunit|nr:NADH-quinone oxidoreductase subunit B family protein [Spirochaetota bacterium]OQA98335.1 MAG: Formate hydrogenlyase subunit 7 [Spirochaetes bacterium ADurb.Bin218]HOK01680.1 NADH-quinone oxidoreductase subunit B family protein [Spirochaetota bacterium]HOK91831.1 NADH-quinone oxidoreductase subunit B family protein [Spirochaetota bacterium]HON15261.1 NADH-quinone oxidoreductase subunit B family protein [Spirochaetota bacterium]
MLANLSKKLFGKSLWIYHCNTGACNGCDIEILNVLTPYYDVERFGMKLVASPRHADVMLLSGAVTRPTLPLVKKAYDALPEPKLVFGVGSCATGGGCWFDSYNVTGGASGVVPVNYFIPGCPPRPEAIIYAVALALGLVDKKVAATELKQMEFPIDVYERNQAWENRNSIYELLKD